MDWERENRSVSENLLQRKRRCAGCELENLNLLRGVRERWESNKRREGTDSDRTHSECAHHPCAQNCRYTDWLPSSITDPGVPVCSSPPLGSPGAPLHRSF